MKRRASTPLKNISSRPRLLSGVYSRLSESIKYYVCRFLKPKDVCKLQQLSKTHRLPDALARCAPTEVCVYDFERPITNLPPHPSPISVSCILEASMLQPVPRLLENTVRLSVYIPVYQQLLLPRLRHLTIVAHDCPGIRLPEKLDTLKIKRLFNAQHIRQFRTCKVQQLSVFCSRFHIIADTIHTSQQMQCQQVTITFAVISGNSLMHSLDTADTVEVTCPTKITVMNLTNVNLNTMKSKMKQRFLKAEIVIQ